MPDLADALADLKAELLAKLAPAEQVQGLQGRIDALEGALQQARAEVSELRGQLSGVHAELASLKTPVRVEQAQREALADRVVALEAAGDSQDRAARANNLVVKGLPEGGSNEDTGSAIRSLLPSVTAGQVLEAKRLGAPRAGATHPRPVLMRFTSVAGNTQP